VGLGGFDSVNLAWVLQGLVWGRQRQALRTTLVSRSNAGTNLLNQIFSDSIYSSDVDSPILIFRLILRRSSWTGGTGLTYSFSSLPGPRVLSSPRYRTIGFLLQYFDGFDSVL
jgi:hypothetical protein